MSSENGSTALTRNVTRKRGSCTNPGEEDESPSPPSTGNPQLNPSSNSRIPILPQNISSSPLPGRGQLSQEIQNEFLTCKICLDIYRTPKCLTCLHTFCEQCIENHISSEITYKKFSDYRDFTCPLCRKRTQLPLGGVRKLPDNFLVSSLAEMLARQSGEEEEERVACCDICKSIASPSHQSTGKRITAKHRCLECNKHLCGDCLRMHNSTRVTKDHSIIDVEIAGKVICKQHPEEVVHFYCEQCQTCICVLCTFHEHRDHEISNFSEALTQHKEELVDLLSECKSKISLYEDNIDQVLKTDNIIREAQQKIRDVAKSLIEEIRQQELQLLDEVDNIYGQQTFDTLQDCTEWQIQLETLCSTCGMAEMVLQGRDIELLLLKKDIQMKLRSLSKGAKQELPSSLHRQITFIPGHVELGIIDIADVHPEEKRTFTYKKVVQQACDSCQTDKCEIDTTEAGIQTDNTISCERGCETETIVCKDQSVETLECSIITSEEPNLCAAEPECFLGFSCSDESSSQTDETEYCSD